LLEGVRNPTRRSNRYPFFLARARRPVAIHSTRIRVLGDFVRSQDWYTIAVFDDPASLFFGVSTVGAKIFGWRIIAASANLIMTTRWRVDMNNIIFNLTFQGVVVREARLPEVTSLVQWETGFSQGRFSRHPPKRTTRGPFAEAGE